MSAVVLSDDILNSLLARPNAAAIPCLQFLKASGRAKPCNCSRDSQSPRRAIEGEHARICVFQLPADRLQELKKLLNTEQLVLYMTTPGFPRRAVI